MPRANVYVVCLLLEYSNIQIPSHTAQWNACARERRMKTIPLKPGNPTASTSRPPNGNTTQHSNDASQAQSSRAHAAVSTATAPPVVTNTTLNNNPHVTIRHAGRWTRFWLSICCSSSEYADGHNESNLFISSFLKDVLCHLL
ncbi:hypothetical protein BDR06DRAFT_462503 [Suillus hirtellus]|nr:hypothetical protein BDR06DRAFT_462503 [Suillus hirtellus]